MAKRIVTTSRQQPAQPEYRYVGPKYEKAVWLCGQRFLPHKMTNREISKAIAKLPALERYFTIDSEDALPQVPVEVAQAIEEIAPPPVDKQMEEEAS